jgi:hypothetical protein
MIIQLDHYRRAASSYDIETVESRRLFGNTVPKLSLREIEIDARRSAGTQLPDHFEGFNAREFIVNAYALASQI